MKNKNKKLASLKSILILVQHLQLKYYGKINIDIDLYGVGFDVCVKYYSISEAFEFNNDEPEKWQVNYNNMLNLINKING